MALRPTLMVALASVALLVIAQCAPVAEEKYDTLERPSLFEGDIAGIAPARGFSSSEEVTEYFVAFNSMARNGIIEDRWRGNVMPYIISDSFSAAEKAVILRSIGEINGNATHFSIVQRTTQSQYVFIGRGGPRTGCWSYVGNLGVGRQALNLEVSVNGSPHCMHHGTIVHELMHAVGFFHEQSRTDRNDYVDINWDNIERSQQHNFNSYGVNDVTGFGEQYDYDSLMHYGRYDFAIDRSIWTIRPKAPKQDYPIGQSRGLSATDIAKLNAMYPDSEATQDNLIQPL